METINIDREKCVGCGQCVKDCVAGILRLNNGKTELQGTSCIGCGHCYAICPAEAVSIPALEPGTGDLADMASIDSNLLLQAMKSRRTIRQFLPKEVEEEKIQKILEAGRYCPTGTNSQDIAYTVLGSRQEAIEAQCVSLFRKAQGAAGSISAMVRNLNVDDHYFFKGAPLVIVVSGKSRVNAALASSYMELMAESLGLGVLYSGFFVACTAFSSSIRRELALPKGYKPITCLVIGYPAVKYHRIPGRKPAQVTRL